MAKYTNTQVESNNAEWFKQSKDLVYRDDKNSKRRVIIGYISFGFVLIVFITFILLMLLG